MSPSVVFVQSVDIIIVLITTGLLIGVRGKQGIVGNIIGSLILGIMFYFGGKTLILSITGGNSMLGGTPDTTKHLIAGMISGAVCIALGVFACYRSRHPSIRPLHKILMGAHDE